MKVRFCKRETTFPSDLLGKLRQSNELLDEPEALQQRMTKDGYLFFRGLIDRERVLKARKTIVRCMAEKGHLLNGKPVLEAVMPRDARSSVGMMGHKGLAQHPDVLSVVENQILFEFFARLFDERATTFRYKWLRAIGNEYFTGCHYDVLYMGRGSNRLHTAWIPFGDIPVEQGTLAVCAGSHNLASFARLRDTYGRVDVDRDLISSGWFTEGPLEIVEKFGGQWLTPSYQAGDVLIFGLYTLHASTMNLTNNYRISCDVRFQPASEPVDERWRGHTPKGHYAWGKKVERTLDEARKDWNI